MNKFETGCNRLRTTPDQWRNAMTTKQASHYWRLPESKRAAYLKSIKR